MDCEQTANMLSAEMDAELDSHDGLTLQAHMAECADCREFSQALQAQDRALRKAFRPLRSSAGTVADNVIEHLLTGPETRQRTAWVPIAMAAAAGFVFAVLLQGPPGVTPSTAPPAAVLGIVSGTVEVCGEGGTSWTRLVSGASIEAGASVRTTEESVCEFKFQEGSVVRLGYGCAADFQAPGKVSIQKGRAWFAADNEPVQVDVPGAIVSARNARLNINCEADETAVLTVLHGEARVANNGKVDTYKQGDAVAISRDGGWLALPREEDPLFCSSWVNPILIKKGYGDPELAERIAGLLARADGGSDPALIEQEIRGLGSYCVNALAGSFKSCGNDVDDQRRVRLVRIMADVAEPWQIPILIDRLDDPSQTVRDLALKGVYRLTGNRGPIIAGACKSPSEIEEGPSNHVETTLRGRWTNWWQENKHLFPRP